MKVAVDGEDRPDSPRPGVSGAVIHALISFIRAEAGEAGLAQALALAAEERSFPVLGDDQSWTSLDDAAALFAAGALVTGDSSIALHVGEDLLWSGNRGELATRLAALGSPEAAVRHIGALIEQFEGATEAVTLEVEEGHALVQVWPVDSPRHAHLCELTRGLLSELPAVFDRDRAQITEHECAARGGRFCRYAVSWEPAASAPGPLDSGARAAQGDADRHDDRRFAHPESHPSANGRTPVGRSGADHDEAVRDRSGQVERTDPGEVVTRDRKNELHLIAEAPSVISEAPTVDAAREAEVESLTRQLRAALAALVEASANASRWELAATTGAAAEDERLRRQAEDEAARTRVEISRLEQLLEGASSPTLSLLERDSDARCRRTRRPGRTGPGRRPIPPDDPGGLRNAARSSTTVDSTPTRPATWPPSSGRPVRTVSPPPSGWSTSHPALRRYGRLAVLAEADGTVPDSDDRVLRMFAQHAANVLDVLTVVNDVRRSDTTARTLLSFGEQLSGLTNLAQALQILADTVPDGHRLRPVDRLPVGS